MFNIIFLLFRHLGSREARRRGNILRKMTRNLSVLKSVRCGEDFGRTVSHAETTGTYKLTC